MRTDPVQKNKNLQDKYGISLEDYDRILKKQKGRCALCFRCPKLFKYDLGVDHCHETGKVRGLLCGDCNRLLTYYRPLDYFKRIVEYLTIDNQEEKTYNG